MVYDYSKLQLEMVAVNLRISKAGIRKITASAAIIFFTADCTLSGLEAGANEVTRSNESIDAYTELESPATTEDSAFISQFFYDGEVYEYLFSIDNLNETNNFAASNSTPLGVISTFAGADAVPDSELETNDESLVGAGIVGVCPNEVNQDSLLIHCGDAYLVYGSKSGNPAYIHRITPSGEEEIRQYIADDITGEGFQELSVEEWHNEYDQALVTFSYLPEQYQYYGTVFVKSDSGMPSLTITEQVWYDADALEVIELTQEYAPDSTPTRCFVFSDKYEDGVPIRNVHSWANYRASYDTNIDGISAYAIMLSVNGGSKAEYEKILTSMQIAQ